MRMAWVVLASLWLAGCAGPSLSMMRLKGTVALPSGPPKGACEEGEWLEIATTAASASDRLVYRDGIQTTVVDARATRRALGVYAFGTYGPLPTIDVFTRIDEPALARAHQSLLQGVEGREAFATGLSYGAMGATLGGAALLLGAAFVSPAEDVWGTLMVSGGVGIVGGIMLTLVSAIARPSSQEINMLQVRRHTFQRYEDDLEALTRGVERHNQGVRQRCR